MEKTEGRLSLIAADQPVLPTRAIQVKTVTFFAVHYGIFHLVYLVFISGMAPAFGWVDRLAVLGTAVAFTLTHHSSFHRNLEADRTGTPNIGTLMFLPYARVIPMHLTILIGGHGGTDSTVAILIFSALKTGADVLMQHVEHALLRRSTSPTVT